MAGPAPPSDDGEPLHASVFSLPAATIIETPASTMRLTAFLEDWL
jgi:hypothetical protein